MTFDLQSLDLLRQWYDALCDVNPEYLTNSDHALGAHIKEQLHLAYAEQAGEVR